LVKLFIASRQEPFDPLATMGNGRVSDLMAIVTEEPDGFF